MSMKLSQFRSVSERVHVLLQVRWENRLHHHQCVEPQEDPQEAGGRLPGLRATALQCHQQIERHWL